MHLNTFTEISESFMAVPDKDFIKERDKKAPKYNAGSRGADAEFPEWHQIQIDPLQEKYFDENGKVYDADVIHKTHGICEYKQYAKDGFQLSENTVESIQKKIAKKIIVWRWSNNNRWDPLEEGKSVGYEIMGIVDAQEAYDNSYVDKHGARRCKLF